MAALQRFVWSHAAGVACGIWVVAFGIVITVTMLRDTSRTSFAVYARAGRQWLQSQPLYNLQNIDGFQYFPTSALLFAPFAELGDLTAQMTWRALNWALYAFGIWRMARKFARGRTPECFLIVTCLAVGCSTISLGNGQANLTLAALILHACADLAERRFWRATTVMVLGLALKPLMAVPLLLFVALYRSVMWRLTPVLGLIFAAPWLLRDNAYVNQQYADCLTKLQLCSNPDRLFEDLHGLLTTLHIALSQGAYLTIRGGAALCVLALAYWVRRRVLEPHASFLIAALAGSYLMLFNPRTQSSSYVMVVAPAALLCALALLEGSRARLRARVTLAIVVCWTISHHMVAAVEFWLRPVACLVFFAVLVDQIRRRSRLPLTAPRARLMHLQ
jgi:hypothetical protein